MTTSNLRSRAYEVCAARRIGLLGRRAACATILLLHVVPPSELTAQQDTTRAAQRGDTMAVQLEPIYVLRSISPVTGPWAASRVAARIASLDERQLRLLEPRTFAEALTGRAGLTAYDDLGSPYKLNLTSRGFTAGSTVGLPSGIAVFVDGVRQNEPGAQEVNFDLMPLAHIESVEMLSGSASLLGRNALGGAVNMITRRGGDPRRAALEFASGSFGSLSGGGSVSTTLAGADAYLGGDYARETGWRQATRARNHNVFASVGRSHADRSLRAQLHLARSFAETAGSLPESIYGHDRRVNFTAGDFEDLDVQQLVLSGAIVAAGGMATFRTFLRRSSAERFNVNQPPDEDVRGWMINRSGGANADWAWSGAVGRGALGIRAGLDAAAHRVTARIVMVDPTATRGDSLTTDIRSPGWDLAGFAIADYRLGPVGFSAGARYDRVRIPYFNAVDPAQDTVSTFRQINPRLGVSFEPGAGVVLYGSAGRSFRAPAILELGCADPDAACPLPFALGDDPPLAPVRAITYEAGVRLHRGRLQISAARYRTDVRDEIVFVTSERARLGGYFTNIPATRRDGAEVALQAGLPGDRVLAWTSYAHTKATFQSNVEMFSLRSDDDFEHSPLAGANDVRPGNRMPMTPRYTGSAGILVRFGRSFEAGADARHVGRQWLRGDEANETSPLPAYNVANIRLGVTGNRWGATIVVTNLFDTRKANFGTFNENRQTDQLERFLMPLEARAARIMLRRTFSAAAGE